MGKTSRKSNRKSLKRGGGGKRKMKSQPSCPTRKSSRQTKAREERDEREFQTAMDKKWVEHNRNIAAAEEEHEAP